MDREQLLNSLTSLDFIAVDLGLFLNTHPTDRDAIKEYNRVITAADILRMQYEKLYGPLCSFRSYSQNENMWQWADNPWPWQSEFNPSLGKEGCK